MDQGGGWLIMKMIIKYWNLSIKSKFTFTDVDNENNKGLVQKCNNKHNALYVLIWNPVIVFIAV